MAGPTPPLSLPTGYSVEQSVDDDGVRFIVSGPKGEFVATGATEELARKEALLLMCSVPCTDAEHHYTCPECGKPAVERVMLPCSSCLEANPRPALRSLHVSMTCGSCQHWIYIPGALGPNVPHGGCTRITTKDAMGPEEPCVKGGAGDGRAVLFTPSRFSCSLWTPKESHP